MGGRPRLRCAPEVRQGAEAGVQRGGPRRGDQGEGGRERRGGEEVHRRGRQAPEEVPGAPGGEGGDAPGGEGLRSRAHEVGEGRRRQERALSVGTLLLCAQEVSVTPRTLRECTQTRMKTRARLASIKTPVEMRVPTLFVEIA